MSSPLKTALLISALFTSSAYAQITFRRRRTSIGRIIAGCVIGGIAAVFFLCLLLMLLRRRRLARRTLVTADGQHQLPSQQPFFGGLWGRNNRNDGTFNNQNYMNGGGNYQQQPFGHNVAPLHGQQATYNTGYSNPNAPPPSYVNDKQSPIPPSNNNNPQHFAPPPGAPPQAHTTGQDPSIVGGFRN